MADLYRRQLKGQIVPSFAGEFSVAGALPDVYRFLADPHCLVKCAPDLKDYTVDDQEHFHLTLRVGIGRIRGPMSMKMEIVDKVENCRAGIVGKASLLGSGVSLEGSFAVREGENGATIVVWQGNAKIVAYLTQIIGGMLDRMVHENIERFVNALGAEMTNTMADEPNGEPSLHNLAVSTALPPDAELTCPPQCI